MKNCFKKENVVIASAILAVGLLIGLVSTMRGTSVLGIFVTAVIFTGLFVLFARYKDQTLSKIVLLGFLLRSALAYFHRFIADLPSSASGRMGAGYEARAIRAIEAWAEGAEGPSLTGAYYYSRVITWFYQFFGNEYLVAQFLNVLLGTLLIFIAYKTMLVLFENKKAAHIAALITALLPFLVFYSVVTQREGLIVFFTALSFYFFSLWLKSGKFKPIIPSLICIFLPSLLHGAMILIGFVYLFIFLFYSPQKKKWIFFTKQLLVGGLLAIFLFTLFFNHFHYKIPHPTDFTPERLERTAQRKSRDRAGYLDGVETNTYFDVIWQTPIRITYFYFAPFPWNIETKEDVMGVIDASLYLILIIFSAITLKKLKKKDKALFISLLLILLVFSTTFAWGTSNYGTSLRHRQKIAFVLIITASYSIAERRSLKEGA